MAKILKFRLPEASRQGRRSSRGAEPAEIVIFPGVRYERWGDAHEQAHSAAST